MTGAIVATGVRASYSTAGSAIWVTAPGGGGGFNASVAPGFVPEAYAPAMVTTDQSGCAVGKARSSATTSMFDQGSPPNILCNYTNSMNGTSSATPVTTGVIALMLQANPALTWRDVKHILAVTAVKIDAGIAPVSVTLSNGPYVAEPGWTTTGHPFHNSYGFGLVDANAAVAMAGIYTAGAFGVFKDTGVISSGALALTIPDNSVTGAVGTLNVSSSLTFVEAVQITVSVTHPFTGDVGIELTSPSNTRSVLKTIRDGFNTADLNAMVLISNAFYGEDPTGVWTIKIVDGSSAHPGGTFTGWTLRVYGH